MRQWYAKYHQDSGPLEIANAVEVEQYLGDDIRREYPYFTYRALHGVLQKRRRPVLLSRQVVETWLDKYAPRRIIRKQSAAAVWGTAGEPSAKCAKVSAAAVQLVGAAAVEDACCERYRREVSGLGLGEHFLFVIISQAFVCFVFFFLLFIPKTFYSSYNPRHPLLRKVALPPVRLVRYTLRTCFLRVERSTARPLST